ncbi:hypothetical protein SNK19_21130 [Ralstonia pseudosolanacearum]|uniref:hypothetical protein n=1 Tax=Ralstonia solanacearum species complex TaxID=3116862 RepID=UPI00143281E9|nr:hypothetical protein [Ralstonia pseudosolanacearum]NKA02942.1 hypothetical protein [Ralstonia solanacearum]MDO3616656.1 hypothetical protein [Ralstonia pseudosolanacearum]NKA55682.1 hypothetical protein [Ralstonia solanacearum]NKA68200.1 hypothetical protein [Ralstonia solanacearum]NKA85897.1 hypothetical protein [Ralstonia solanacearum]
MSDNTKRAYIRPDDFNRFAQAKEITGVCPSCGKSEIALITHGSGEATQGLPYGRDGMALAAGYLFEVLPIECGNCGYLWLYNRKTIIDWLAKQAQEQEHGGA